MIDLGRKENESPVQAIYVVTWKRKEIDGE